MTSGSLTRQQVLVSYSAAPSVLSSPNWTRIYNAFVAQLPLRNIHWKSSSRAALRTIQELDITLTPLDQLRDESVSQVPVTLLEKPLLHIYFLFCEDNDAEAYRTTWKKAIKDWHTIVTSKKNQEWMILQIIGPVLEARANTIFALRGSVLDKIRADFNTEKKDRCAQFSWSPGTDNPAAWGEVMNKVKDGVLQAFDSVILVREEEVRRSESQSQMPGWNFCTFFILKESLATSYGGVNLFDDALNQYDELETSFYQVLKEKNLSWFGTLINPEPKDDSGPLLSASKKPYRDLILANRISVFDFRVYLLARQCELLARMGRITEVCTKVGAFLGAFGRRLREVEDTLPRFFVESWIHSSALSVVEQCDSWVSSPEQGKLPTFSAGKGELLELARNQLDIVGIQIGHLPPQPPFSMVFPAAPTNVSTRSTNPITNPQLLEALHNPQAFYELYLTTTNRAIEMYAKAGRRKFALKLHGSLAALDVHRGRREMALATYTSLPAHYQPHQWTSLEFFMLSRALRVHQSLDKPTDREWIHILLAYLKSYIEGMGTEALALEGQDAPPIDRLLERLQNGATSLDADLSHPDHPALRITVPPDARTAERQDGSVIDVTVHNRLPCALPANQVSITMTGRDTERLRFSAETSPLPPGTSILTLFCPTTPPGSYLVELTEVKISRLALQWPAQRKSSAKTTRVKASSKPCVVRIPKDMFAFDVSIHQPKQIELGRPSALLLDLYSGRNVVTDALIRLSTSSTKFQPAKAALEEDNGSTLEIKDGALLVRNIAKDTNVTIRIPHSDASAVASMKVQLEIEYKTSEQPDVDRVLIVTRTLTTTLPVSVNVEDFFRGKRLFSKFTVSTVGAHYVRVSAAHLEPPRTGAHGLTIIGASTKDERVLTVTPSQPANILFSVDSEDGPIRESLTLRVRYRMLDEEVQYVVRSTVEKLLSEEPSYRDSRLILVHRLVDALRRDSSWIQPYTLTGELNIFEDPDDAGDLQEPLARLRTMLSAHKHDASGPWCEIRIPVDVPNMNIVATTSVDISQDHRDALYAGQPIGATLTIHTSFHWGSSSGQQSQRYRMQFDLEEMVRDWLVSGKKRGDFEAKEDGTFTAHLTLIALHHGELMLPKVTVSAAPIVGELTMGSLAIPSTEVNQLHGAEKVMVLPRGGRSTFMVTLD